PPFGTKNNAGIDIIFLKAAIQQTSSYVYSLHKSSTRRYVTKMAKQFGAIPTVLDQIRFNIEKSYKFHKSDSVDIAVDLIRFDVKEKYRNFEIQR
ncbi:hypothetical protein MXB_565, partial [Myxobolus squamalis]